MLQAKHKLNSPGIVSHITQCTAGNELLFLEDSDYVFILELLKEITKKYSLNMYAFCLMSNHVHLLLSPTEKNLYDAMRDLFSRYAMRFNRKYERKGHLFGGPYRQAVCFDNSYFLTVSLYIHLLPVKSGWVKKYLIKQFIARGYKRSEIAESLGICRKTVYRILNSQI